jgi:hypothetical protein
MISESDCMRRTTTNFLNKLGVQDSDVNIIEVTQMKLMFILKLTKCP